MTVSCRGRHEMAISTGPRSGSPEGGHTSGGLYTIPQPKASQADSQEENQVVRASPEAVAGIAVQRQSSLAAHAVGGKERTRR